MNKKNIHTMMIFFLVPAIFSYVVIFLYPTIRTTLMSLFEMSNVTDPISEWEFVGFDNYAHLLDSPVFVQSMLNFVKIWAYGGALVFTLALMFAVILTSGVRFKGFYRSVIYLPNIVSAVAMGTMWLQAVYSSSYGIIKEGAELVGWESVAAINWIGADQIFFSLLVAYCFGMVGYYMLIFMAAIEGIPRDYYEAALLEGATTFHKFRYISLPLIKDVFRTNLVLWTVSTVGFFVWSQIFSPYIINNGTVTPLVYMYESVFGSKVAVTTRNVGAGAAVGVILTFIVLVMFVLSNKVLKSEKYEY